MVTTYGHDFGFMRSETANNERPRGAAVVV